MASAYSIGSVVEDFFPFVDRPLKDFRNDPDDDDLLLPVDAASSPFPAFFFDRPPPFQGNRDLRLDFGTGAVLSSN